MRDLRKYGIDRDLIWIALREQRIIRIRNGWVALRTISPIEAEAIRHHGLLTCASAASIRDLPCASSHFHLRSKVPRDGVQRVIRRTRPQRVGAMVGVIDMIEDYLSCQPADWSLALVDQITRKNLLTESDWKNLMTRLTIEQSKIVLARSGIPESPLESIVRSRLARSRIPHSLQVPIGRFRADFVVGQGVVLEVHGAAFHAGAAEWERDRRKVTWLRAQGWDVLEFSYSQLINEWPDVLRAIQRAVSQNTYSRR